MWSVIGFGIFCVTPDGTGFLQGIDSHISAALHIGGWRTTPWSATIDSPAACVAAAVVAVVLLWSPTKGPLRRWEPVIVTAVAGLVAGITGVLVARPGPGHLGDLSAANATSFPSTVAAMGTGLVIAVSRRSSRTRRRDRWFLLAAILVVAIGITVRLITAASWPLDEIGGVAVGLAVAELAAPSRTTPRTTHRYEHRPHRTLLWCLAGAAILLTVGRSYVGILTAPGSAPFDQRTIEWLRDHRMSAFVDRGESWWLWQHLPSSTATISELPRPPIILRTVSRLPASVTSEIQPSLPAEGQWAVAAADRHGAAEIATTSFRPDPSHPSLVAGAAWINTATTKVSLIAGTRQPSGRPGPAGGRVPDNALPSLLAVFNSGYKMQDTPGGALIEGRATREAVDGLATLAVRPDGTATVGEWGATMTADLGYTSIRQNLHLMVNHGAIVDGVAANAGGRWGSVRNTLPTWRSGVGVTVTGDLIYVAGNNLTLGVLASALVRVGAVTAMELDIHKGMVTFNLFTHHPVLAGYKLLPDMTRPADRYLTADWRDFVMVNSR